MIQIKGTKNSTAKEISIFLQKSQYRFQGTCPTFFTLVDGKYSSALDYDKFRNQLEFSSDEIMIRKGSTPAVINILEFKQALISLMNTVDDEFVSDIQKKYDRIVKGIDYAVMRGNRLRANSEKITLNRDQSVIVRNHRNVKEVTAMLQDVFTQKRDEYVTIYKNMYTKRVEDVAALLISKQCTVYEHFYKSGGSNSRAAAVQATENYRFYHDFFNETFTLGKITATELKPNYKELVEIYATDVVKGMEEGFMDKNVFKIGTIVANKDNLKKSEVLHVTTGAFGFEGRFRLYFNDGSMFDVTSQAVWAEGMIQIGHYRYPTTFHNVKYPNGQFHKMQSEREMIDKFSKTK